MLQGITFIDLYNDSSDMSIQKSNPANSILKFPHFYSYQAHVIIKASLVVTT